MKIRIGEIVEQYNEKCGNPTLTIYDVHGINKDKQFFSPTIQVGNDTSDYKVVPPGFFACNLMHVGRDFAIPIACNENEKPVIVSPAYQVFKVAREDLIIKEYFYIIQKKIDFDRYAAFCTDSSVRDGLDWTRFCEIEIEIPSIETQRKFVNVHLALVENQRMYEQGLDDLKLVCDAYIENLRKKHKLFRLGDYIEEVKEINTELVIVYERGLNKEFGFVEPGSMSDNVDLSKRKIIRFNTFVYPSPHFGEQGTIGLNKGQDCIMSQMYTNFKIINSDLLPDYLFLWLKRDEFMRYGFFAACDSIRDTFDIGKLGEYKIPIPDKEVQKSIADIYDVLKRRKNINEALKTQLFEICSILVKGSLVS